MRSELLQPTATITAALIANQGIKSVSQDGRLGQLFIDVYLQLARAQDQLRAAEAPKLKNGSAAATI